jgi:hypothetical protein
MRQGDVFLVTPLLLATIVLHTDPSIVAKGSRRSVVSEALASSADAQQNKQSSRKR